MRGEVGQERGREHERERRLHKQPEGRQMNYITESTELIGSSLKMVIRSHH